MREEIANWYKDKIVAERRLSAPYLQDCSWEQLGPVVRDRWLEVIDPLLALMRARIERAGLTEADILLLVESYPLLDFSFQDDYREEMQMLLDTQLTNVLKLFSEAG